MHTFICIFKYGHVWICYKIEATDIAMAIMIADEALERRGFYHQGIDQRQIFEADVFEEFQEVIAPGTPQQQLNKSLIN